MDEFSDDESDGGESHSSSSSAEDGGKARPAPVPVPVPAPEAEDEAEAAAPKQSPAPTPVVPVAPAWGAPGPAPAPAPPAPTPAPAAAASAPVPKQQRSVSPPGKASRRGVASAPPAAAPVVAKQTSYTETVAPSWMTNVQRDRPAQGSSSGSDGEEGAAPVEALPQPGQRDIEGEVHAAGSSTDATTGDEAGAGPGAGAGAGAGNSVPAAATPAPASVHVEAAEDLMDAVFAAFDDSSSSSGDDDNGGDDGDAGAQADRHNEVQVAVASGSPTGRVAAMREQLEAARRRVAETRLRTSRLRDSRDEAGSDGSVGGPVPGSGSGAAAPPRHRATSSGSIPGAHLDWPTASKPACTNPRHTMDDAA